MLSIPVLGEHLSVYVARPEDDKVYPGLILIEEIWGVNDHVKSVCDRYAAEGFVVYSPELLPGGTLEMMTPEINVKLFDPLTRNEVQPLLREAMAPMQQPEYAERTIQKLQSCVDDLVADPKCNGKVGVMGFCFGGTYAFQLAAHDSRIKAAVPFYGRVQQPEEVAAGISCPVLNFDGAHDEGVMAQAPALEAAMKKNDKEYTHVVYPDAGHAFFNDTNARAYRAEDSKDAWEKSLVFLKKNLV